MMVSVLILTFNEETNLPDCLESVGFSDDIVVFDSYSTDRTADIAKEYGTRVVYRKFDNYAAHRNAALGEIEYRYPWVLMIDADERVPRDLKEEISGLVDSLDSDATLYRVRRKDFFWGRWLKHSSGYPTWFGRLVKVGTVNVEREINEEYHTHGTIYHLRRHLIHRPFNKGIAAWLDKHNRYSSMEADVFAGEVRGSLRFRDAFSTDPVNRRRFLKQVAFRMPCRPLLTFCYLYFIRMGFLDGKQGLAYCRLRMMYEYMINLKTKELRRHEKGLPM